MADNFPRDPREAFIDAFMGKRYGVKHTHEGFPIGEDAALYQAKRRQIEGELRDFNEVGLAYLKRDLMEAEQKPDEVYDPWKR